MTQRTKTLLRVFAWVAGLGLCTWHYLDHGIRTMWAANNRVDSYDQIFYLRRADETARLGEPRHIQRSRMPLFPRLLAFFHRDGLSEEDLFIRFKFVNVVISIFVLLAMLAVARWALGVALAVPLMLGATFTFVVFKAVLVQPEILFYLLYFLGFVLMAWCLRRPDWRLALGIGGLLGVTHLTKGSALPMLAAFLAVSTTRAVVESWQSVRRSQVTHRLSGRGQNWVPIACLGGFLVVTGQFFWNSTKTFGHPLYDLNTQIHLWAESPKELAALQAFRLAHRRPVLDTEVMRSPLVQEFLPQWVGNPELLADINRRVQSGERVALEGRFAVLPNAKNYFRRHSLSEAAGRLASGVAHVVQRNLTHRNGYGAHLAVWLGTALCLALLALIFVPEKCRADFAISKYAIAFVALNLLGNLLLYGWFDHVSNRNRFFLTLFLPLMVSCGWSLRFAARSLPWRFSIRLPNRFGGSLALTPWRVVVIALWAFAIADIWDLDAGPKQLHQ
ncbi:MAG: hypothetical protein ACR2OZ_05295 [Verrucomicrobiales bacterium]